MNMLKMCLDKRVIAGLAATAGLVWWLAPGLFAAALPLLILAICPLSMLLMMKAMGGMNGQQQGQSTGATSSAAEPTVSPGQLSLPVAGGGAAQSTSPATAEGAPEANGAPAEQNQSVTDTQRSELPVAANGRAETAPPR